MSICGICEERGYLDDGWCCYYEDWCTEYQNIDVEIAEQLEGNSTHA